MKSIVLRWIGAGILLTGFAWAQEPEEGSEPPEAGRGVIRISLINGDVSVLRGDAGEWVAAAVNAPLVTADHVATGNGSRAELQLDYANFLRLDSGTEVRLALIDNQRYQLQIARGTVTFRVLRDSQSDVEIDTANVGVRPVKRGVYRITVSDDGQSEVTVRSGEAETFTPRGSEKLQAGHTMLVRGTQNDPEFQVLREIAYDDWDRWNQDRDHRLERSQSYRYVSRDIYGAEDLDNYGRWVDVPTYGSVWCPSGVAPDWAPYRAGRWAWVDWYGWTWVSYDPWGWAPYHYGRWFYSAPYGWCWFPGARYHRQYWSPALVAFFGFGHGVHVGVGFGSVGWVPLAPYEPFHAWYGRRYYGFREHNVTVINNTNIVNVYRNARITNGVTGIDAGAFGRGGRGTPVRVSEVARQASLVRGPIPITPVRDSIRISDRGTAVAPVRASRETQFFTHRQPVRVERMSFDQQQRGAEQFVQRTFGGRTPSAGAPASGMVRTEVNRPVQPGGGSPEGWRRVQQEPAGTAGAWRQGGGVQSPGANRETTERGSWSRFGTRPPQSNEQSTDRSRMPAREPQTDWRSFGQPAQNREMNREMQRNERAIERERAVPRESQSEWRRPANDPPARNYERQQEAPRYQAPRNESIRINPPIVRQREEARPAPRMERAPSPAPSRMERGPSAPSHSGGNSGGGGGGGRSGGGNGGGHSRR